MRRSDDHAPCSPRRGSQRPLRARAAAQAAPSRDETLLLVQEYGPNSLDMQGIGSSQPVNGVALNCYDRLVRFKPVKVDEATTSFDMTDARAGTRRELAGSQRRHERHVQDRQRPVP